MLMHGKCLGACSEGADQRLCLVVKLVDFKKIYQLPIGIDAKRDVRVGAVGRQPQIEASCGTR